MLYNFNGTNVYYDFFGQPCERVVLLLHGWGSPRDDFSNLINNFPQRSFLVIVFPTVGKSKKEIQGWSIYTYAQMLMSLCEHLKIKSVDIVAHSFGGRIAIILSAVECSFVHSCILVDSAGMKPRRSIKYHYKVVKYKLCRKLGKNTQNQGSKDYIALSPEMKKIFVGVVQTHLEAYAEKIKSPTLIFWGEKDKETPLYMGKRLNKLIQNSRLKVVDGGHFAFLECKLQFHAIVKKFWEEI